MTGGGSGMWRTNGVIIVMAIMPSSPDKNQGLRRRPFGSLGSRFPFPVSLFTFTVSRVPFRVYLRLQTHAESVTVTTAKPANTAKISPRLALVVAAAAPPKLARQPSTM